MFARYLNTHSLPCSAVAPINFAAKWHVGQLRPEEMAWKIASGEIAQENVPPDVYDMVKSMNLSKATDFTQYPEGSPKHPSWPAMHSAASSMSLWLPVIANLTEEQYCQVLLTDYAVSFARTVAGVHYRSDNMAGLEHGTRDCCSCTSRSPCKGVWSRPRCRESQRLKSFVLIGETLIPRLVGPHWHNRFHRWNQNLRQEDQS